MRRAFRRRRDSDGDISLRRSKSEGAEPINIPTLSCPIPVALGLLECSSERQLARALRAAQLAVVETGGRVVASSQASSPRTVVGYPPTFALQSPPSQPPPVQPPSAVTLLLQPFLQQAGQAASGPAPSLLPPPSQLSCCTLQQLQHLQQDPLALQAGGQGVATLPTLSPDRIDDEMASCGGRPEGLPPLEAPPLLGVTLELIPLVMDGRKPLRLSAIVMQAPSSALPATSAVAWHGVRSDIVLGRASPSSRNALGISDPRVSRTHAHIGFDADGRPRVTALGSHPLAVVVSSSRREAAAAAAYVTALGQSTAGPAGSLPPTAPLAPGPQLLYRGNSAPLGSGDELHLVVEQQFSGTAKPVGGASNSASVYTETRSDLHRWAGNSCAYVVRVIDPTHERNERTVQEAPPSPSWYATQYASPPSPSWCSASPAWEPATPPWPPASPNWVPASPSDPLPPPCLFREATLGLSPRGGPEHGSPFTPSSSSWGEQAQLPFPAQLPPSLLSQMSTGSSSSSKEEPVLAGNLGGPPLGSWRGSDAEVGSLLASPLGSVSDDASPPNPCSDAHSDSPSSAASSAAGVGRDADPFAEYHVSPMPADYVIRSPVPSWSS